METRSSPSLGLLKRLARQADIGAQDISLLSKPALFGHLQSQYDYQRLERAHQIALKRGSGDVHGSGNNSSSRRSNISKRQCRSAKGGGGGGGGGSSSAPSSSALTSSTSSLAEEQEALPPASIFIQTRSHSRMLLATANGARPGARLQPASQQRSPSTSPRPRAKLQLAGGRGGKGGGSGGGGGGGDGGGGGGSSSSSGGGGKASAGAGCSSDGIETTKAPAQAPAPAAAAAPEGKSESGLEARENSENTPKHEKQQQQQRQQEQQQQQQRQQQQRRNGKGKGKAREADAGGGGDGGGDGGKERSCVNTSTSGAHGGSTSGNKESLSLPNELDPIMLVKVGKDHYRFVRPNGRVVMYNLDSLVDYFISTGDFLEPETRLPFSDEELRTIDLKAKEAGLSKPSVLAAKRDTGRYAEQKFQQDALVGLERMTSELVTAMLRVVEGCDREEGEIRLVTEIFPPFADLFKQIFAADKAFALQCMQHYTSWLEGPPNRPTEDEMGFLDIILGFLKQLQECGGSSSLGF